MGSEPLSAVAIRQRFEALPQLQRRRALALLCRDALAVWQRHMTEPIEYVDSAVGIRHRLDLELPGRALDEIDRQLRGESVDPTATLRASMEPTSALQDDDLRLPWEAEYAFYAIYNLHGLVFQASVATDRVVLDQAIAATLTHPGETAEAAQRLRAWWARVGAP